jgi:hypothetical protein
VSGLSVSYGRLLNGVLPSDNVNALVSIG